MGRKEKKKKNPLMIIGIVIGALLLIYGGAWGVLRARQAWYMSRTEHGPAIPGLSEGMVPQGFSWLESEGCYLVCGYMSGGKASRIYMVWPDGRTKEVSLLREDGSVYSGHAGGITAAGDWVYISNASKLFYLRSESLAKAENGAQLAFEGYVEVPCRASFCSSDEYFVYVGEYHADGYETDESHAVKTASGETYQALVLGYERDDESPLGLKHPEHPGVAFAVPDKVQGFCVKSLRGGARVFLSVSAGVSDAKMLAYGLGAWTETIRISDWEMPIYVLDETRLWWEKTVPFMGEDLEYRDGTVIQGFESAAKKFGSGWMPGSERHILRFRPPER